MQILRSLLFTILVGCLMNVSAAADSLNVSGELKKWHKVTLTFNGPDTSETAQPNPFTDYRLDVTFTQGDKIYRVPGYFAADGNAAESGATAGNCWRVHFAPDSAGVWDCEVSFRTGKQVAVSDDPAAGTGVKPWDGMRRTIEISPSDKSGRDFRAHGRLNYVGEHYPRFAETGKAFLKQGADAPENLLAYADFDGDFKTDGHKDNLIKTWEPHVRDWAAGDPSWQNGKGKGLIGALNYLASEEMNAISFLTLNIAGDDQNVFPYLNYNERNRFDCSRLDQWEIVFEHADRLGLFLHFKTQETENEMLLDDGDVGPLRKLYYRELIARFAHHLAMNWNLGEENGALGKRNQSTEQRIAMTEFFQENDPYQHPIVIHNPRMPDDLLGDVSRLNGLSLQTNKPDFSRVHALVLEYIEKSRKAGKRWLVACDEPGDATHSLLPDAENPSHDNARMNALWGTLMAGGWGNEWYFGYKHAHSDLTCQDWRSRDLWWDQCRIALHFFRDHVPNFDQMRSLDKLVRHPAAYCFVQPEVTYLVYLKTSDSAELMMGKNDGTWSVRWFDPQSGGELQEGSVIQLNGQNLQSLGEPPHRKRNDWVVLITRE